MTTFRIVQLGIRALLGVACICSISAVGLKAQGMDSGYTHPSFIKTLLIVPPAETVSWSFWVDQTTSLSMTMSSLVKNLTVKLINPSGVVFTHGQPVLNQFECALSPDPLTVPDAPGANYFMDLENPMIGLWTLQIMDPVAPASNVTIPLRIAFNNQVGPVLFGGSGNYTVGSNVSFSVAVMDGNAKVSTPQISATLHRLDDHSVTPVSVSFADNGQGADYATGDAIYSAYVTPHQPGDYMLQVELAGDASTGHFQRSTATGFKVVTKTASITGHFTIQPRVGVPK
jgi:hypothetical protein